MAERMTHWLEEETAQTSHPEARRRSTNCCISGKIWAAIPGKIRVAGLLHDFFPQSAMHGDHFSAHDLFGDLARFVVGVSRTGPAGDLFRHQSFVLFQFPPEKSFSGVSGPERAIAVECGDSRTEAEYTFDEFGLPGC